MLYRLYAPHLYPDTLHMKTPVLVVVLLVVLAGGGYYGFQQYQGYQSGKSLLAAKVAEATRAMQAKQQAEALAKKQAADAAVHQEIDGALKAMKVSSIMPGQPGIVIIGKQEYAEGDKLPLPKGRKASITKVQEDGVLLACEGQSFRLDPPAAPDLAASRKPR